MTVAVSKWGVLLEVSPFLQGKRINFTWDFWFSLIEIGEAWSFQFVLIKFNAHLSDHCLQFLDESSALTIV